MKRALDPGNPWGLTVRECATVAALAEAGDFDGAAKALGESVSSITNAIYRSRIKMGAANNLQMVARFIQWMLQKASSIPSTAWVCPACEGRGFRKECPF